MTCEIFAAASAQSVGASPTRSVVSSPRRADRWAESDWRRWRLATPETILRWYREKVAVKYDGSRARCATGRPRSPADRVGQLLTMALENPSWGYTRLHGALKNLGPELGRSTIARILKEQGIEPAPPRGKTMSWKTFLRAHWGAIAAADCFSVEVLTVGGFVRYLVLFVVDLKTRRVHVAGVTCHVDGVDGTDRAQSDRRARRSSAGLAP